MLTLHNLYFVLGYFLVLNNHYFVYSLYLHIVPRFLIIGLMTNPIVHSDVFTEDDWKLVQLVLTLFRNILAVQEISLQQKAGGTASQFVSLRDRFLELLFHENVMDLVLVITQHIGDSHSYLCQDNLLLLEIFHYVFMGQEPELIANVCSKGPKVGFSSSLSEFFLIEMSFVQS